MFWRGKPQWNQLRNTFDGWQSNFQNKNAGSIGGCDQTKPSHNSSSSSLSMSSGEAAVAGRHEWKDQRSATRKEESDAPCEFLQTLHQNSSNINVFIHKKPRVRWTGKMLENHCALCNEFHTFSEFTLTILSKDIKLYVLRGIEQNRSYMARRNTYMLL